MFQSAFTMPGGLPQMNQPFAAPRFGNMQQMPIPTQPGFAVGAPQMMPQLGGPMPPANVPTQPGFPSGMQQMPFNQFAQTNDPYRQQFMDWRSQRPELAAYDTRDLFRQGMQDWRAMRPDQQRMQYGSGILSNLLRG